MNHNSKFAVKYRQTKKMDLFPRLLGLAILSGHENFNVFMYLICLCIGVTVSIRKTYRPITPHVHL